MEHQVKFIRGYDCMTFPCRFDKKCTPGNSHGKHGMEMLFLVKGEKGAVQFVMSTGWMPFHSPQDKIGVRRIQKMELSDYYPMPTDLGYHSYKPHYENHTPMKGACSVLDGAECYYDGSSLNCNDAYYAFVNGGEEALWDFLEQYYACVFEEGKYPTPKEYCEPVKEPK